MSIVTDTTRQSDWGQKILQLAIPEGASLPNWSKDYFHERFTEISSFEEDGRPLRRQIGIFKFDNYEENRVLVVWKTGDTGLLYHKGDAFMQAFMLAHRLALRGPPESLSPVCVGFVGEAREGERMHGYIFEMPEGSNDKTSLKTLQSILGDINHEPVPLQRVSLATNIAKVILRLHEADWLHRGIHSGNILFCFDQGKFDIRKPILSGFDYPRPPIDAVRHDDLNTRWDIYRWPNLQGELPRAGAWRIMHDIYSMGPLIIEIAHWKPLYTLLCLKRWPAPSQQALRIRSWLIEEERYPPFKKNPLLTLHGFLPEEETERFLSTASRCIHAFGEKGILIENQSDQSEGAKAHIRKTFSRFVIEELDDIMSETANEEDEDWIMVDSQNCSRRTSLNTHAV